MQKFSIIILFLCAIGFNANSQGIDFKKLDWEQNLKEASSEQKLIYIDFYTTWCAPCTYMAKKFFGNEEIGKYYNKHFYSLKVDAEKEGKELAKKYSVNGYPTNLFINPANEKIIYKVIGVPRDNAGFVEYGTTALDEYDDPLNLKDYAKILSHGKTDKQFLMKYLKKLERLDLPNQKPLDVYSKKYFKKNIDSVEIQFMKKYTKSIDNKTFDVFKNNKKAYNDYHKLKGYKIKWENELTSKLYYTNQIATKNKDEKLFKKCLAVANKYVSPYERIGQVYYLKTSYYEKHNRAKARKSEYEYAQNLTTMGNDYFVFQNSKLLTSFLAQLDWQSERWSEWQKTKLDSVKGSYKTLPQYAQRMTMTTSEHLNAQAWNVFEAKNKTRYKQAIGWAKKSYEMAKEIKMTEAAVADTYANLLFVSGKKSEAIKIEKEAIKRAKELGEKFEDYEKTLKSFTD